MISMKTQIPLSVPFLGGNELKYVEECLDTGWVSSVGSYVDEFEKKICEVTGAGHAIACVNGTAALHTVLLVIGGRAGDEVIVPTVTFIAPVNAVSYVGARPVFMDCDEYYNIDVAKTLEFIKEETVFKNGATYNKKTGCRVIAVIGVHVFGNAVDLKPLLAICKERNIQIIEDAAESLGTYYSTGVLDGMHTGTVGDIGCYSFNGNKIITTGGGGMIVTNNPDHARRARYLTTQAKDDAVRYVHNEVGYNYRMTNIQAAIGVAQLEQLSEFIVNKVANYNMYKEAIDGVRGLHLAEVPPYANNNLWMYPLQIDGRQYPRGRDELMKWLDEHGVQTRPLWCLNHLQKPYRDCQSYKIQRAYEFSDKTLFIPCSVNLTSSEINSVIENLRND